MRRRWVKVLAVVVVILVGLFVGADRLAVHEVEQYAAKKADEKYGFGGTTDAYTNVDIHGFPFLTQAAGRSLDDVTLTAGNMDVDNSARSMGSYLKIDRLRLDMHDMQVASTFDSVRSGSVTGTVSIRWSDLGATIGRVLGTGGPVGITPQRTGGAPTPTEPVRLRGTAGGRDLPSGATIGLSGGAFQIQAPGVTDAPNGNTTRSGMLSWPLNLPGGLTVNGFTATPDDLQVAVSGSGVTLGAYGVPMN